MIELNSKHKLIEDAGFKYNPVTLNYEHPSGESIAFLSVERKSVDYIKDYIKDFKFKLNPVY